MTAKKTSPPQKYELKIPTLGESITEATIGTWLKSDGDYVEIDEPVCEIESEKATLELPAEKSGVLKILVPEGETVKVGDVIAEILVEEGQTPSAKPAPVEEAAVSSETEVPRTEAASTEAAETPRISPVAAKILEEKGISPSQVKGTGPGGKITKEDALKAQTTASAVAEEKSAVSVEAPEKKEPTVPASPAPRRGERVERREKMSTLRKTIARRLVESKNTTAMLTTFNEVDMTAIIRLRKQYKELFQQKYGVKLGFMSFFVRAVCIALEEFPVVNAFVDGDEIVYHDYCDISIAVSTPHGLVVPVIRNADQLSLAEIEAQVAQLAEKARTKKLSIEEMTGGTFSITNGGVFGSLLSTPIINPPQSAILGMHTIKERPVAVDGQVVIRPMMYLSLSYDHRIIDGRESVLFLVRVKELLEDPTRLVLEV